jgi:hypothetical protein
MRDTTMQFVFGIDPGPEKCGVAVLREDTTLERTDDLSLDQLRTEYRDYNPSKVVVEGVTDPPIRVRTGEMIKTAVTLGRVLEIARHCPEVVTVPPGVYKRWAQTVLPPQHFGSAHQRDAYHLAMWYLVKTTPQLMRKLKEARSG